MSTGKITTQEVAHMAALSRLSVEEKQQERFAQQFENILSYMTVLEAIDTSAIEPLYSPAQHTHAFREDTAAATRSHDAILANAPEQDGQYFIVPRIV